MDDFIVIKQLILTMSDSQLEDELHRIYNSELQKRTKLHILLQIYLNRELGHELREELIDVMTRLSSGLDIKEEEEIQKLIELNRESCLDAFIMKHIIKEEVQAPESAKNAVIIPTDDNKHELLENLLAESPHRTDGHPSETSFEVLSHKVVESNAHLDDRFVYDVFRGCYDLGYLQELHKLSSGFFCVPKIAYVLEYLSHVGGESLRQYKSTIGRCLGVRALVNLKQRVEEKDVISEIIGYKIKTEIGCLGELSPCELVEFVKTDLAESLEAQFFLAMWEDYIKYQLGFYSRGSATEELIIGQKKAPKQLITYFKKVCEPEPIEGNMLQFCLKHCFGEDIDHMIMCICQLPGPQEFSNMLQNQEETNYYKSGCLEVCKLEEHHVFFLEEQDLKLNHVSDYYYIPYLREGDNLKVKVYHLELLNICLLGEQSDEVVEEMKAIHEHKANEEIEVKQKLLEVNSRESYVLVFEQGGQLVQITRTKDGLFNVSRTIQRKGEFMHELRLVTWDGMHAKELVYGKDFTIDNLEDIDASCYQEESQKMYFEGRTNKRLLIKYKQDDKQEIPTINATGFDIQNIDIQQLCVNFGYVNLSQVHPFENVKLLFDVCYEELVSHGEPRKVEFNVALFLLPNDGQRYILANIPQLNSASITLRQTYLNGDTDVQTFDCSQHLKDGATEGLYTLQAVLSDQLTHIHAVLSFEYENKFYQSDAVNIHIVSQSRISKVLLDYSAAEKRATIRIGSSLGAAVQHDSVVSVQYKNGAPVLLQPDSQKQVYLNNIELERLHNLSVTVDDERYAFRDAVSWSVDRRVRGTHELLFNFVDGKYQISMYDTGSTKLFAPVMGRDGSLKIKELFVEKADKQCYRFRNRAPVAALCCSSPLYDGETCCKVRRQPLLVYNKPSGHLANELGLAFEYIARCEECAQQGCEFEHISKAVTDNIEGGLLADKFPTKKSSLVQPRAPGAPGAACADHAAEDCCAYNECQDCGYIDVSAVNCYYEGGGTVARYVKTYTIYDDGKIDMAYTGVQ